jgi:hypothetical protein
LAHPYSIFCNRPNQKDSGVPPFQKPKWKFWLTYNFPRRGETMNVRAISGLNDSIRPAVSASRDSSRFRTGHYAGRHQALRAAQMHCLQLPAPLDCRPKSKFLRFLTTANKLSPSGAASTRKHLRRGRGLHEVACERSVRSTTNRNRQSTVSSYRGTPRYRPTTSRLEPGTRSRALWLGGSDNRRPWQVRAPGLLPQLAGQKTSSADASVHRDR